MGCRRMGCRAAPRPAAWWMTTRSSSWPTGRINRDASTPPGASTLGELRGWGLDVSDKLTASQIYPLLLQGGFSPKDPTVRTAIAQAESAGNLGAVGDVRLQNGTWGPSVGLFQIRTLKAETGTGTDRDIEHLTG